jgi:hypothetical protein
MKELVRQHFGSVGTMKTIRRAAWPWLLLAFTCGCATKKMEVHYQQVEACQIWSDQNDDPAIAWQNPLVVFRLVSVTNTSAQGTPNSVFYLQRVFYNGDTWHRPEVSISIPSFFDISQQLAPGQSVHFPQGDFDGLFVIQVSDSRPDVQGGVFYLNYDSNPDESVFMVRDPSPSTFHPYCGKTALSVLR